MRHGKTTRGGFETGLLHNNLAIQRHTGLGYLVIQKYWFVGAGINLFRRVGWGGTSAPIPGDDQNPGDFLIFSK